MLLATGYLSPSKRSDRPGRTEEDKGEGRQAKAGSVLRMLAAPDLSRLFMFRLRALSTSSIKVNLLRHLFRSAEPGNRPQPQSFDTGARKVAQCSPRQRSLRQLSRSSSAQARDANPSPEIRQVGRSTDQVVAPCSLRHSRRGACRHRIGSTVQREFAALNEQVRKGFQQHKNIWRSKPTIQGITSSPDTSSTLGTQMRLLRLEVQSPEAQTRALHLCPEAKGPLPITFAATAHHLLCYPDTSVSITSTQGNFIYICLDPNLAQMLHQNRYLAWFWPGDCPKIANLAIYAPILTRARILRIIEWPKITNNFNSIDNLANRGFNRLCRFQLKEQNTRG